MRLALILVLLSLVRPALAAVGSLHLELGRFVHPAFVVEGLEIRIGEGRAAEMRATRLTVGERTWDHPAIHCATFRYDDGEVLCRRGRLVVPGLIEGALDFRFDTGDDTGQLELRAGDGGSVKLVLQRGGRVELTLDAFAVSRLAVAIPQLAGWQPTGRIDGRFGYSPAGDGARLVFSGKLREGGFASADGLRAAEQVALDFDLLARRAGSRWDWEGHAAWSGGEAYLHPLYLVSGPAVDAAGRYESGVLTVDRARFELEGTRAVAVAGEFDLTSAAVRRLALSVADADLAVIGPRFLAPALAPAAAGDLQFSGHMSAGIEIDDGVLHALDLAFDEAGFRLAGKRLSFGPLSGVLPWRASASTRAHLNVGGGRWQKLELGAFEVVARLDGRQVDVERVGIPVLDGAVVVENLSLRRQTSGWHGAGALVVEPVSMNLLTAAVGLPAMSGTLAASLPGVLVSPGEIRLDGALVIAVFDGYVQATRLQLLEPFGVAPHLYADVEARGIDLAQLTETFSFGSVTGLIDADIAGLELARWRPVKFDARVASSPGSYRRRVSQRAVQNIGALGGSGAVAALQRGVLGLFDTFGYREIGISCVLRRGVCMMDGLGEAGGPGNGFYIMRGGGIPALNVIGYNRRVDWHELIERLQRVIASNTAPIIQ